ncbi:hypothetical protein [Kitasatospora sp. DSM 101779]|uniref:hypothetical protein n=1 Tax=Kitasatospora sp. DSM 101779 TaxID=2853165 RepID=UPI0021DAF67D|nr:hypothetical protein [Kitasatospora sp. DSM 101779]MCU7822740.1 hypothetical protein [Kitasatospora sp. DSM 101779]
MSEQRTARMPAVLAGLVLLACATACAGGTAGGAPGTAPGSSAGGTAARSSAPASAQPENGVAALPGPEIVQRSVAALKEAGSVRITGRGSSQGQTVTFDLSADTAGNCAGTMGLSGQGTFRLVKLGTQLWVKPDEVFWRTHGGAATEDLVGDKYLKTTTDNTDFSEIGTVCDLDALGSALVEQTPGGLAVGRPVTVDGTPAVPVTGTADGATSTLTVATRGRPYPLRMERTGGEETGRVELKEFGTPVPTQTPAPSDTIDLDRLNGGGDEPTDPSTLSL